MDFKLKTEYAIIINALLITLSGILLSFFQAKLEWQFLPISLFIIEIYLVTKKRKYEIGEKELEDIKKKNNVIYALHSKLFNIITQDRVIENIFNIPDYLDTELEKEGWLKYFSKILNDLYVNVCYLDFTFSYYLENPLHFPKSYEDMLSSISQINRDFYDFYFEFVQFSEKTGGIPIKTDEGKQLEKLEGEYHDYIRFLKDYYAEYEDIKKRFMNSKIIKNQVPNIIYHE